MHWIHLTDEEQLSRLITKSQEKPQVIFQHTTPCSITETAKTKLSDIENASDADCYFLDLRIYLNISKKVDEIFHFYHHAPDVVVIKDGHCYCSKNNQSICLNEVMKEKHHN